MVEEEGVPFLQAPRQVRAVRLQEEERVLRRLRLPRGRQRALEQQAHGCGEVPTGGDRVEIAQKTDREVADGPKHLCNGFFDRLDGRRFAELRVGVVLVPEDGGVEIAQLEGNFGEETPEGRERVI